MAPPAQTCVRYRGGLFPVSVPVVCGRDIPRKLGGTYWWEMPSRHLRARRDDIRAIVLHHTAGEGNGTGIFNTLVKRRLSVHFTIDSDGRIIQHADMADVTFHGGETNEWSVGIEITNRGVPPCLPRAPRDIVQCSVHGKTRPMLRFYDVQVEAARALVRDLCELHQLPFDVPRDSSGEIITTVLPPERLATYRGILGHLHFKHTKIDPVPHIFGDIVGTTK